MSNNTMLAGHVEVEDFVVFGGLSGVHQFSRVELIRWLAA